VGLARKIGCHRAIRICIKRQLAPDLITEVLGNLGNAIALSAIIMNGDGVERRE
jgi:hypothetical protein